MRRMTEWILVVFGMLVCIAGAIGFWQAQLSSPSGSIRPLPALVLIEWMILGVVGAIAALGDRRSERTRWTAIRWMVCGALFGLLILGLFSIGPIVLLAALAFLGAARLAPSNECWMPVPVGVLTLSTIGNIGILSLLIGLAHG
jgi:hypothetical protein